MSAFGRRNRQGSMNTANNAVIKYGDRVNLQLPGTQIYVSCQVTPAGSHLATSRTATVWQIAPPHGGGHLSGEPLKYGHTFRLVNVQNGQACPLMAGDGVLAIHAPDGSTPDQQAMFGNNFTLSYNLRNTMTTPVHPTGMLWLVPPKQPGSITHQTQVNPNSVFTFKRNNGNNVSNGAAGTAGRVGFDIGNILPFPDPNTMGTRTGFDIGNILPFPDPMSMVTATKGDVARSLHIQVPKLEIDKFFIIAFILGLIVAALFIFRPH